MSPTRGQQWWRDQIENRAFERLRQLRMPGSGGSPPLWDGTPPVPVDHVVEHLLGLSLSYEEIEVPSGSVVFGCIRPDTGEIVLNERYLELFERIPGLLRYTKCHEAGHADLFGAAQGCSQFDLEGKGVSTGYSPLRLSASRGPAVALSSNAQALLRSCPKEVRTEVLLRLQAMERNRWENGEDPPQVRRAVDRYAAALLMPRDLVRSRAEGMDLGSWRTVARLAEQFQVSKTAMRIRMEEVGLIFGVDEATGRIITEKPFDEQISLL